MTKAHSTRGHTLGHLLELARSGHIAIDAMGWPHVRIVASGHLRAADVGTHFDEFRALFERSQPFTIEYDTVGVTFVEWSMRREYARFIDDNAASFRTLCHGVGFVITSPVVGAALTTVLWVTALPCPYAVLRSSADASAWCRNRVVD